MTTFIHIPGRGGGGVRTGMGMYFMTVFLLQLSGNNQSTSTLSDRPTLSRFDIIKNIEKRHIRNPHPLNVKMTL